MWAFQRLKFINILNQLQIFGQHLNVPVAER